jgi:hypothetical protein
LKWNDTSGELEWADAGGGGAFTDLSDAPSSYDGSAGDLVRANSSNDGLEFFTPDYAVGDLADYALLDGSNTPFTGDIGLTKSSAKLTLTNSGGNAKTIALLADNSTDASYLKATTGVPTSDPVGLGGTSLSGTTGSLSDFSGNQFSWFGWVNTTNAASNRIQPFSYGTFSASATLTLQIFNGTIYVYAYNPSISSVSLAAGVNDGQWHFIGFTYNNGTVVIYKDNTSGGGSVAAGIGTAAKVLEFKNNSAVATHDEHGLWNRVLSSAEVAVLYNGGAGLYGGASVAPYDSGLVAGWHLDESSTTATCWNNATNNYGLSGQSWTTGKVPAPPSDSEVQVIKVTDGYAGGANGTLTFGNSTADTVLQGGTLNIDILGSIGIGAAAPSDAKFQITRKTTDPDWALRTEYQTASTNTVASSYILRTTSTGNMADDFGGGMVFAIQDNAGVENNIATIYALRNGADNSGALTFNTYSAGTRREQLRISRLGNLILPNDSQQFYFGAGADSSIYHSGTNWVFEINAATNAIIFNEAGADTDFRIKSDTDANAFYLDAGNSRIGLFNGTPTAKLHLPAGTATAGTAPLKFTSGTLLTASEAGAIEFNNDDYYATITTGAGGAAYISQYPPAHNGTYVKATSVIDAGGYPYFATDPTKSVVGDYNSNVWFSNGGTNQRINIDLGSSKIVTRIYYENNHKSGAETDKGARYVTVWGSNTSTAFDNVTYATDTDWTQIGGTYTFDRHVAANQADPKYQVIANTTAYRYYSLKVSANWGGAQIAIRRIELQTANESAQKSIVLSNSGNLTSGRIPFATTNGRLTDDSDFTFATDTLTVTKIAATQFTGDVTIADTKNIILNTTTGTKIGTAADQKLGFYNATPVVQQTGIAALKVDYTAGDLDTEAEIITAINTTNTAINALRTALNALGLTTSI